MRQILSVVQRRVCIVGALACLLALGGCSSELSDATAVTVTVQHDSTLGLSRIGYQVFETNQDPALYSPVSSFVAEGARRDHPFVVEKRDADEFLLVVQGFAANNPRVALVEQRVRARFVPEQTVELPIYLSNACANKQCDTALGQTCYGFSRDAIAAGTCGATPGPYPLAVLTESGQEGKWAVPTPSDAGADTGIDGGHDAALADAIVADAADGDAESCIVPKDGLCDPVSNCQCSPGTHCQLRSSQLVCVPVPTPAVQRGLSCESSAVCAEGLACVRGVCTPYCRQDEDCGPNSTCALRNESDFGYCYAHCGPTASVQCAAGVTCLALDFRERKNGSYCVVPYSTCPGLSDGVCDEVGRGETAICAVGTDVVDCCTPKVSRDSCSVITQCGCSASEACRVEDVVLGTTLLSCQAFGSVGKLGPCTTDSQCVRGMGCYGSLCKEYCSGPQDCGVSGSQCVETTYDGVSSPGVKVCVYGCNFAANTGCGVGATCARFTGGDGCVRTPTGCAAAYLNNKVCDEKTRVCAAGTDVADCAAAL